MKHFILFITGYLSVMCCAAQSPSSSATRVPRAYELYSWQAKDGNWNFQLMVMTDRQKTPDEIFDQKEALHGVKAVGKRILALPIKSEIVWVDQVTFAGQKLPGTDRLKFPPGDIVKQVRRYALKRKIELAGP